MCLVVVGLVKCLIRKVGGLEWETPTRPQPPALDYCIPRPHPSTNAIAWIVFKSVFTLPLDSLICKCGVVLYSDSMNWENALVFLVGVSLGLFALVCIVCNSCAIPGQSGCLVLVYHVYHLLCGNLG